LSIESPDQEDGTPVAPWERISSEVRHEYKIFHTRRDRVRSPTDGEEHEFDVIQAPDAVTVIALTPAGEMVLVEQFRHGTREVVLEFPGGVLDEDESPLECGPRELLEETGYSGRDPELIGTISLNASWQDTLIHVVRLRDVVLSDDKDLDESEDTRVRLATVDDLQATIRKGGFNTAVAIAALGLHLWNDGAGEERSGG